MPLFSKPCASRIALRRSAFDLGILTGIPVQAAPPQFRTMIEPLRALA